MLKIGMELTLEKIVQKEETAKKVGSGGMEVFATPCLLALMENAAYNLVQREMEVGMTTVGIEANLKHLKANLVGDKVICTAKLINIDGRKLEFEIIVKHNEVVVGSANHSRFIVNEEKFISKLK